MKGVPADAIWVCEALDREYGALTWRSHGEPLDLLVQTILSQHTSDLNSGRAFDQLRRRFPGGWDAVRTAATADIADAIRCGGLADAKAPRLRGVLQSLWEETGSTDLTFLKTLPDDQALAFLTSFPGVGPKTAACVLMFSLGRPVLPVDTHVFRVSHRLGLVDERVGEGRAHGVLQAQLPPEQVYTYHVQLIRHGRRVCLAQRPRCESCVLAERCAYRQRGGAVGKGAVTAPPRESLHGMKGNGEGGSKVA